MNEEKFNSIKNEEFFGDYIESIQFFPVFQKFGFSQYFLYIYPENLDEIDYKLLFLNTFQKVSYPAEIDSSIPLFIKYLFPYKTPNKSYLNWITKSKKAIFEYILFSIQKVHRIIHFNFNIEPMGWNVDYKKFKTHIDNIINKSRNIRESK